MFCELTILMLEKKITIISLYKKNQFRKQNMSF